MSLRIDRVQLDIIINNDQARKQMRQLTDELRLAERELKKLPEGSEQWVEQSKKIDGIKARIDNLKREIGITGMTLKELTAHQRELNMTLMHMNPKLPEYKKLQAELRETTARIRELRQGSLTVGQQLGKLADGFNKYFNMGVAATAAVAGVAYSVKEFIAGTSELEDSLADMRKTTGMTEQEVRKLNTELGKINTRTSRQELRDMAVVAGQLGIAKEQVYGFVESVDKLNVALGDEIKGGAEEVATIMGTLRNVLTDMKTSRVDEDMLRIGNALNELGAAGFATSPVVADFANRIGGIGIPLGLVSEEVLGLSATLQELNVSTERGGTAVGKILQKMTNNTAEFSRVAGMSVEDFTTLVNQDLFGAFTKVVEGSRRGGESATVLAGIIKDLEIQGAGASEIFAKLSGNTDMLREKVDLAGRSLQNTDSITREFNIKNATLGATVDKLRKDFYGLITMPGVVDFFKNITFQLSNLVNWFRRLPETIEKYRISLTVLSGVILTWTAIKLKSTAATVLNNLVLKEGIGLKVKDAVVLRALIIQEQLRAAMVGKTTIAQKAAALATVAWSNALKLLGGPIGWIGMGITGFVAAVAIYNKNNKESIKIEKEKASLLKDVSEANIAASKRTDSYANSIRELNKLSRESKLLLKDEIELMIKKSQQDLKNLEMKRALLYSEAMNRKFTLGQKLGILVGMSSQEETSLKNAQEAVASIDEQIKQFKQTIIDATNQKVSIEDIFNAEKAGDAIGTATDSELDEKLAKYRLALSNAVKGSEEYIRIQNKVRAVNKLMGSESTLSEKEQKALETKEERERKAAIKYEELLDQVRVFESKKLEERLSGFEKEIAAVEAKYNAEIDRLNDYLRQTKDLTPDQKSRISFEISGLEADKHKAVKAVMLAQEQKFTEDALKLRNKLVLAQLSGYEQELQEIEQTYQEKQKAIADQSAELESFYARELFLATGNAEEIIRIEAEKAIRIQTLKDASAELSALKQAELDRAKAAQEKELQEQLKQASDELAEKGLSEKERELKAIDDKYAKMLVMAQGNAEAIAEVEKAHADATNAYLKQQRKEVYKEIVKFAVEQAQLIADTMFTISNNNRNAETDAELSKLEKQKQAELSKKNLTESQKNAIDTKYQRKEAEVKTRAWQSQQKAAETQALVNGALAVTNILATMPWADFGVMHAIAIAGAVAATLAQVAIIRKEKMPQFYSGGYTGDGGKYEPAGIVHKGEYVVPQEQLEDKEVRQMVNTIERKRLSKTQSTEYSDGGFVAEGYRVPEIMLQRKIVEKLISRVEELKQTNQVNEMNVVTIRNLSESVSNISSTQVIRKQETVVPGLSIPRFDIPSIEMAVRTAPAMLQAAASKQVAPAQNAQDFTRLIERLDQRMSVMERLDQTLSSGIRAKMVYSEWEESRKKVDDMISDSSI